MYRPKIPSGPSGWDPRTRVLTIRVCLNLTNAEIVRDVREIVTLMRRAEREGDQAPRRSRGRPKGWLSDLALRRVVRREVDEIHQEINAVCAEMRKAQKQADRKVILAAAIRRAWPHRRADELAAEALRDRLSPRKTAALVVARLRDLTPRSVERHTARK